jgi:hypothetical protein
MSKGAVSELGEPRIKAETEDTLAIPNAKKPKTLKAKVEDNDIELDGTPKGKLNAAVNQDAWCAKGEAGKAWLGRN